LGDIYDGILDLKGDDAASRAENRGPTPTLTGLSEWKTDVVVWRDPAIDSE
jgi:hypothetical protein